MRERTNTEKYWLHLHGLRDKLQEFQKRLAETTPSGIPPIRIQLEVSKAILSYAHPTGLMVEVEGSHVPLADASTMIILAAVGHLGEIKEHVENSLYVQASDLEQACKIVDSLLVREKQEKNPA